jgi:phosphatidylinositol alpha-1,6-mannosyltransferase
MVADAQTLELAPSPPQPGLEIPPTLVLTRHFPPSAGGVQTFSWELLRRLAPERLVVVAPAQPGARAFDDELGFPVLRRRSSLLARDLRAVVREHGCEAAWVTAAAPLGLCAPLLRAAGIERIVASTHGQELAWLRVPLARTALRRLANAVDVLTYLSPFTRRCLAPALKRPEVLRQLAGAVDLDVFRPAARTGGPRRPTVVTVARLVRRKGHDVLLRGWPRVLARVPDARLLVVGDGPLRSRLERTAAREGLCRSVFFVGHLPRPELVARLQAANVFVAPCRDLVRGFWTEGLGLAVLEASAVGLPVVVGRSGGSGDTVLDGRTGILVWAEAPEAVADGIADLLLDEVRARRMGQRGRQWVRERWTWQRPSRRLAAMLRVSD